jgi:NAD(P)-dependent dehydrogenase (short-subunit alcohol dehydrogenase family)
MTDFTGKTALITGAGSGIGRAAAQLYAARGGTVIAFDRSEAVHETAEEHDRITAMTGDVGEPADIDRAVAAAVATGGLDFAFANAGIGGGLTPLLDLTVGEWESVLRVNLIGVFLTVQAAARVMVPQRRGSIVATASVAGIRSGAGGVPYSASKAGVINLVATCANQLAGSGVRVNAVCPGLTETGMTLPFFDYARARGTEAKLGQLNPLKRAAHAAEVAEVALFLAGDAASYVNGQAIAVDGGLSSSHPVVPGRMA